MENRHSDHANHIEYKSQPSSDSNHSTHLHQSTIHPNDNNHILPFSILLNLPKGFHIQKQIHPKLVYDLSYLSMSKEICKKSIEVDHCGYVDVDLHVLKIKGCLSFFLNLCIEPIQKHKMCSTDHKDNSIYLCAQDTLYVDHILKYSVDTLPYYMIDENHIQIRKLEVEILEPFHNSAKISGE
ncbi:hypothetical protein, partial [Bacillus mycoides]|uniref:hypothetical protein n=1 Tax=Bacillus mycoides TaxID=1405 RepID=UPI003A812E24